ncbi:MAG: hypothetical protein WCI72_05580, partial [archaeon]
YQDRVNGWFLDFATALTRKRDAGFVILSLAIGYIEGNQQFRDGSLSENKSCPFFIKGMRRIFDKALVPEKILKSYYKQIRCGLFHDGMTKKDVSISRDYPYPVDYRDGKITINPTKFLEKIKEDLVNYISELAHNETLRRNFESRRNLENKNGR